MAACLIWALAVAAMPHIRPALADPESENEKAGGNYLARSIRDELAADKSISATELRVEADQGEIVLHGRVPSLRASRAAQRYVSGRIGVRKVVNLLDFEQDTVLSAGGIDSALSVNPYLTGRTVTVALSGKTAILSGVVYSRFEREQARRTAERVAGVDSIINRIEVVENYLEAGENDQLSAWNDPAVQGLIDSYLDARGIDHELSITLNANIPRIWKDSLAPIPKRKSIVVNPETDNYEPFNFFGLGIAVGKYIISKVRGKDDN